VTNVLLHIAIYLGFAVLISLITSAALATASAGLQRRLTGQKPPPSESVWGRTLLGFGGWFAASLAFLGILLAPEARGLQLWAAVVLVGAGVVLPFIWKSPVREGLDRMDRLARGESLSRPAAR
jgi:hypothetical protein